MTNSEIYKPGNIIEWKQKVPLTSRYTTVFRAYIGTGIDEKLIQSLDIIREGIDKVEVVGNKSPFSPDIVQLDEDNLIDYHPVRKLHGKTVFILIHGINSSEIMGGEGATFYTTHRRKVVHTHIKEFFPDATILHYLYPSAMKTLEENSRDFLNIINNLEGIYSARHIIFVGYSLGGLIIRHALNSSSFLRNRTSAVLTVNAPHRGTPLVSLSFAPPDFWSYIRSLHADNVKMADSFIKSVKEALHLTYMTGSVMAPGYLALRWDSGQHFDKFANMTSPTLKRLNEHETYENYIFSASIIPMAHKIEALKILIEKYRYNKWETKIGLFFFHRLITEIGRLLKVNRWPESDGAAPLSSQIPVRYFDNMSFIPTGPFMGDHIGIILGNTMWRTNLMKLKEIWG